MNLTSKLHHVLIALFLSVLSPRSVVSPRTPRSWAAPSAARSAKPQEHRWRAHPCRWFKSKQELRANSLPDRTAASSPHLFPVGRYSVSVAHDGFATQERSGITLTVGQSLQVDFVLGVEAVQQQVEVDATGDTVNTTTQQTAGLIDERQVKELPLNGRSYDELLTLNPATVNYTGERSGSIGTSNSSVGSMFAVSGRRPQDNLFLLNGIEYTGASLINVTPGGTSGELLGVDAVREFNVATDTYGASYGKRDGAQVSIVTTSGTNQLHGTAFEFIRNSALDARNYFDAGSIPEFQRNQFGGSLGGPDSKEQALPLRQLRGVPAKLGLERRDPGTGQPGTPGVSRPTRRARSNMSA